MIDQTRLPVEFVETECRDVQAVWEAITMRRVRGFGGPFFSSPAFTPAETRPRTDSEPVIAKKPIRAPLKGALRKMTYQQWSLVPQA